MSQQGKKRAVATCENCGHVTPVQIWLDESIHPIGGKKCCEEDELRVLELEDSTLRSSPRPMGDAEG